MIITPHLGIELTQKCNLDCKHCFRGKATKLSITRLILEKVFDEVKYVDCLDLSGGEVFLAYDELKMLLEIAKEKKCKINHCSMLINGTIYDERIYNLLSEYFGDDFQIGISNDSFHDNSIARIYGDSTNKSNNPELKPCNLEEVKNNMRKHILDDHCFGFQRVSRHLIENGRAETLDLPKKKFEAMGYYYGLYERKNGSNVSMVGPMIFIGADGYISDINTDISKRKEQSIGNILNESIISSVKKGGIKKDFKDVEDFFTSMSQRELDYATHQGDHLIFKNNKMAYTTYVPDEQYMEEINRIPELINGLLDAGSQGKAHEYLMSLDFSKYPHDLSRFEHEDFSLTKK